MQYETEAKNKLNKPNSITSKAKNKNALKQARVRAKQEQRTLLSEVELGLFVGVGIVLVHLKPGLHRLDSERRQRIVLLSIVLATQLTLHHGRGRGH